MTELNKVLNGLKATLSDNGKAFTFIKTGANNIYLVAVEGNKMIDINATPEQFQQILNRIDLWEKTPCERYKK